MLTNQNTTQENLKKCLSKKKLNRIFSIITIVIVITSMLCINASAIVIQEVGGDGTYPSIWMDVVTENENLNEATLEVSGAGLEDLNTYGISINTSAGNVYYNILEEYVGVNEIKLAQYSVSNGMNIERFWRIEPLNINLWEWTQLYNDTIIWQLYDFYFQMTGISALYRIEIPYFNNSAIMGTEPLVIDMERNIGGSIDEIENRYVTYDIDLPSIDSIVEEAIEIMENESQSNITFQYKGEELKNNNYVTKVYAEDGTTITIDFKEALSTILVMFDLNLNGSPTEIAILNYNDAWVNGLIQYERSWDFEELVILNDFERSAEITINRKEKDVRLLNWLGSAISGIMNTEIFPNFSLGSLLSVIIMIPIILWILKLVAGG